MSLTAAPTRTRPADAERRQLILEAAERAFVRNGFHATTMQGIADEVAMSAGNLYRYFPSKETIVEGLCERDQAEHRTARGCHSGSMRAGLGRLGGQNSHLERSNRTNPLHLPRPARHNPHLGVSADVERVGMRRFQTRIW